MTIAFKSPELFAQWRSGVLHPMLVEALNEFDQFSVINGLPAPLVTSLVRPPGKKFSWHSCRCAADIRNRSYMGEQLKFAFAWLAERYRRPQWECISHDVGQGPHFHLAVRDLSWRTGVA